MNPALYFVRTIGRIVISFIAATGRLSMFTANSLMHCHPSHRSIPA